MSDDGKGRCPVCKRLQPTSDTGLVGRHRIDGYMCSGSGMAPDTEYQPRLRKSAEGSAGRAGALYYPPDDEIWRVAGRAMDD